MSIDIPHSTHSYATFYSLGVREHYLVVCNLLMDGWLDGCGWMDGFAVSGKFSLLVIYSNNFITGDSHRCQCTRDELIIRPLFPTFFCFLPTPLQPLCFRFPICPI